MKEQRFKIGDNVTFKNRDAMPGGKYAFGGCQCGGQIGSIKEYENYSNYHKCFEMLVTNPDGCTYRMLESEFVEYDKDVSLEFKDGDFVIVEWLWNNKTYLSKFQSVAGRDSFNGYYAYEIGCRDSEQLHTSSFAFANSELGTIRLATTEEILKYLPKDHQDRVKFNEPIKYKKVEELEYPDAVHCTTKEQVKAINNALTSAKLEFSGEDRWYLIGGAGSGISPYKGHGSCGRKYINYEFSDLIFPETKDDYLNVRDIKVGDTVICIEKNESKFNRLDGAGAGWFANYEFKVTDITVSGAYNIYFGGKGGNGVYSDAVRLVKRKADKVPTITVSNLTPNEWYTITTNSGDRYTAKFKTIDGKKIIASSYYCSNNDNTKTGHIYLCDGQDISSIVKADMDEVYKHFPKEQPFSVGTYIVPLQNGILDKIIRSVTRGKSYEIFKNDTLPYIKNDNNIEINFCKIENDFKWFATEAEAEEYGKTIRDDKPVPFTVMYGEIISIGSTFPNHPDAIKLGCLNWAEGESPAEGCVCKIINAGLVNNNQNVYVIEQYNKHYLIGQKGVRIITESEYIDGVSGVNDTNGTSAYIEYDQLEPGQYYFEVYKDRNYIFKADSEDHQEVYIDTTRGVFGYDYTNDSSNDRIRLATMDERMWLDRCIEAKKFLTSKDALDKKPSENVVFKFKTGDAVISNCGWSKGLTGIVIAIHDSTLPYTIKFNNANHHGHNGYRDSVRLIYGKNIESNLIGDGDYWFMDEKSIELATGMNHRVTTLDFTNDWESSLPTVNFLLNL